MGFEEEQVSATLRSQFAHAEALMVMMLRGVAINLSHWGALHIVCRRFCDAIPVDHLELP